ncbi:uncharacterized protein LOC126746061 [Anthonomus grandis grandis]|uniref:uncharacterized protein LOC126746061 n=1 Tax=Anthonomus grandis grandis TaxID=2921223 RepID=UPI002166B827|nr:uncharacterized protein LOC126746061 [Anthonomus grandis grandis]
MAAARGSRYDGIFGNQRVLRPGENDEKLEQILKIIGNDDSDIETSDDEKEIQTMDNLMGREEKIINEELVSSSEEEEEEDRIPLSVLRENLKMAKQSVDSLKRKSWRRDDTFAPPNFEGPSSECSAEHRYDWTTKWYLAM